MTVTRSPAHRLAWIKRRARRLALAFSIDRHLAVHSAAFDWSQFNPQSTT